MPQMMPKTHTFLFSQQQNTLRGIGTHAQEAHHGVLTIRLLPHSIHIQNKPFSILLAHSLSNIQLCHRDAAIGAPGTDQEKAMEGAQAGGVVVRDRLFFGGVCVEPVFPGLCNMDRTLSLTTRS